MTLDKNEFKTAFTSFAKSAPEKDRLFMRHGERTFSISSLVAEVQNETLVGKTVMETLNAVAAQRRRPVGEMIKHFTDHKEFGILSTAAEARVEQEAKKEAAKAKAKAAGIKAA